jgi:hypothetical protein
MLDEPQAASSGERAILSGAPDQRALRGGRRPAGEHARGGGAQPVSRELCKELCEAIRGGRAASVFKHPQGIPLVNPGRVGLNEEPSHLLDAGVGEPVSALPRQLEAGEGDAPCDGGRAAKELKQAIGICGLSAPLDQEALRRAGLTRRDGHRAAQRLAEAAIGLNHQVSGGGAAWKPLRCDERSVLCNPHHRWALRDDAYGIGGADCLAHLSPATSQNCENGE